MSLLTRAGPVFHNKSNTLRQQQQQLTDMLVQVSPNNCVAVVWRMVVAVPLGYINVLLVLYFLFSRRSDLRSLLLDV